MAPAAQEPALKSLESLIQSAKTLLEQLQAVLLDINKNSTSSTAVADTNTSFGSSDIPAPASVNALSLAHDSASLIRAHATKISLLIINEPFTPSAVTTVIRELVSGPITGLVSAAEACDSARYTALMRRELAWRCKRVLQELFSLLSAIPVDGTVLSGGKKDGGSGSDGRGSLASTGVLWAACDSVTRLSNMGVGGFFVQKTEEWRDTLKDVMEEMKEWGDEEADEDDDDDDDELEGSGDLSTQDILDNLMNGNGAIPADDPDRIRPRLESSLRKLRLVGLFYQAVIKRRLKKLPPLPFPDKTSSSSVPSRLDEAANILGKLPDSFGDLACSFYELRVEAIDRAMDQCFLDAFAASEMLRENWDGGKDEFTEWTIKFQGELKKE